MYLFCISCKKIVATIKVPTLISSQPFKAGEVLTVLTVLTRKQIPYLVYYRHYIEVNIDFTRYSIFCEVCFIDNVQACCHVDNVCGNIRISWLLIHDWQLVVTVLYHYLLAISIIF